MIFKNLKIEINETQPIDVVLKELERLGYKPLNTQAIKNGISGWLLTVMELFLGGLMLLFLVMGIIKQ